MTDAFAYQLEFADHGDAFRVESFVGEERVNSLYSYVIDATTELHPDELDRLLGVDVRLSASKSGGRSRVIHGIAATVQFVGFVSKQRLSRVRVELVPRAWLMGLKRGSTIFQGASIVRVVQQVLAFHGIPSRLLLSRRYPGRSYCTQYEETDLAFVERLLAEAGIFYFFEQPRRGDLPDTGAVVGGAVQAVAGAVGASGSDTGVAGRAAGSVVGWMGSPRAIMVLCDSPAFYADADDGTGSAFAPDALALARAAAERGVEEGAGALGDVAGGALGGLAAEVGGGLLDKLMGDASGSAMVLPMRADSDALRGGEAIHAMERTRRVHSLRAVHRVYDPRRPNTTFESDHRLSSGLVDQPLKGDVDPKRLVGAGIGLATDAAAELGADAGALDPIRAMTDVLGLHGSSHEIYDHDQRFTLPDWGFERHQPERTLAPLRADEERVVGASNCPWLSAGHRFTLVEHPSDALNQTYVVTRLTTRWSSGHDGVERSYENRFEALPASVPCAPAVPARRFVQAHETAIVVGSEAVSTNESGQVRVRFHWDRRGPQTDSTCWIRVMQTWAGPGFGTQHIPRAGSEVVVGFEGGDPDRPLVLGCVYNAISPPPFQLPAQRTVSGIHTRSVPGGEGFNELSFDDKSNEERVYLHAQRLLQVDVEESRVVDVRRDDRQRVGGDRHLSIEGHARVEVDGAREAEIRGNDQTVTHGNRVVRTQGSSDERVEGSYQLESHGDHRTNVRGSSQLVVEGDVTTRVAGSHVTVVGSGDSGGSLATHVEGALRLFGSQVVDIGSSSSLVLRCGNSFIELAPDHILLSSPEVVVKADDRITSVTETYSVVGTTIRGIGDNVVWRGEGAAIALGNQARIDGQQVLLNSPAQATDEVADESREPTVIELVDQHGKPIPRARFRVVRGDGSTSGGVLDDQGRAELDLEADAEILFPGLFDVTQM